MGISQLKQKEKKRGIFLILYFKRFLLPWPSCTTDRWLHNSCVKTWSSFRPCSALSLSLRLWKRSQVWEPLLIFVILNSSSDSTHRHTKKQALQMSSVHMQGVSSFPSSEHCLLPPTLKVAKSLRCSYSLEVDRLGTFLSLPEPLTGFVRHPFPFTGLRNT